MPDTPKLPVEPAETPSAPVVPPHVAQHYGVHNHDHDLPNVGASGSDASEISPVTAADDPLTGDTIDAAVDDITAAETNPERAAEEAAREQANFVVPKKQFWVKLNGFFVAWWGNKWARYITLGILVMGVGAAVAVPAARYAVLNTVGVRSSASVIAIDATTQQPLRNVQVTLGKTMVKTDVDGVARFGQLRLGPASLEVKRVAFAPQQQRVTIGWGSNPLGSFALRATGIQYIMQVTDYLSGKPLAGVEVVSDEANALADKHGKIVLTVDDRQATTLPVTVKLSGYRSEAVVLNAEATAPTPIVLVPGTPHMYVSKQSGTYDVYAVDVDGKNSKLLLHGTGLETSNLSVVANADGSRAALLSTRENVRDSDGFLLTTLTIINTETGSAVTVDHGAQIQLLAWNGDRLVYRVATPGASAANSQRYRLLAYSASNRAKLQLTTANQFTASQAARGYIYYAASSNDPRAATGLFRIKPDGSGKQKVLDGEVWTVIRSGYDTFAVQTASGWSTYSIGNDTYSPATAPTSLANRAYLPNSTDKQSIFLDKRAGHTALFRYDTDSAKETSLTTHDGVAVPLVWAGDVAIVYRVATANETADYAVSPQGGQPHKVADVWPTYGITSE